MAQAQPAGVVAGRVPAEAVEAGTAGGGGGRLRDDLGNVRADERGGGDDDPLAVEGAVGQLEPQPQPAGHVAGGGTAAAGGSVVGQAAAAGEQVGGRDVVGDPGVLEGGAGEGDVTVPLVGGGEGAGDDGGGDGLGDGGDLEDGVGADLGGPAGAAASRTFSRSRSWNSATNPLSRRRRWKDPAQAPSFRAGWAGMFRRAEPERPALLPEVSRPRPRSGKRGPPPPAGSPTRRTVPRGGTPPRSPCGYVPSLPG